ncbi:MAG: bis(5'-nucleosyl)-tetraphosphatase (symmetrical) YqeK [Patescibacteria group bacterium]
MNIRNAMRYLEKRLSAARFNHCVNVMDIMSAASALYHLDHDEAVQAGLLHDIAREFSIEEIVEILEKHDPLPLSQLPINCHVVEHLHGPAGAVIVSQRWDRDIKSDNVLIAIRQHSGAFLDMSKLSQCLHVADVLVPIKDFRGRKKLERFFMSGRLAEAEILLFHFAAEYFREKELSIPPAYAVNVESLAKTIGSKPPEFFSRED